MPRHDNLGDDIHHVWRQIRRETHPGRRGDLTPEQLWLLRHLRDDGPLSVGELGRLLGVSQSAATTACQRLERAGLATRTRDSDDERIVRVAITAAGNTHIEAWQQRQQAALAPLLASMTVQEAAELRRLLRKMLNVTSERPMLSAFLWSVAGLAESLA
jgi:DNA-binding MarR family transcriptional regulator